MMMRMNEYHNESAACYLIEKYLDQKENPCTITRVFSNVTGKYCAKHPIEYRFFRSYILIKIFLSTFK